MGTRWRAYHIVLLTLAAFCNSQRVPQSQIFSNGNFNRNSPRTLRQQSSAFNSGRSSFRTSLDQFRRPTIRRPTQRLPVQPTFSLPQNVRQRGQFDSIRSEPFASLRDQGFPQPFSNAQGQFISPSAQGFQNPTAPSITRTLPKPTLQSALFPADTQHQPLPRPEFQQITQGSQQPPFPISQQAQGFTQQKQPQYVIQLGSESFKPSEQDETLTARQPQRIPEAPREQQRPQVQQSPQHRFKVQQTFSTLSSPQQPPRLSESQQLPQQSSRFQQPQLQTQQRFPTLSPSQQPPRLSEPQQQSRFQQPQFQTQQRFPTLSPPQQPPQLLEPQRVSRPQGFEQSQLQTQQTFPSPTPLLPTPQPSQELSQSRGRFQQTRIPTQQSVFTPPSQSQPLPQLHHRFQKVQQPTDQTLSPAPPLRQSPPLAQPQNRFQASQQNFPALPSLPQAQLPQPPTIFNEEISTSQLPQQQVFQATQEPQTFTRTESTFHEDQLKQTLPTLPPLPKLPRPPKLKSQQRQQNQFQGTNRQKEQTLTTTKEPQRTFPQVPQLQTFSNEFQEAQRQREDTVIASKQAPQLSHHEPQFQQFQEVQRQREQVQEPQFQQLQNFQGQRERAQESQFQQFQNVQGQREQAQELQFQELQNVQGQINQAQVPQFQQFQNIQGQRERGHEPQFQQFREAQGQRDRGQVPQFSNVIIHEEQQRQTQTPSPQPQGVFQSPQQQDVHIRPQTRKRFRTSKRPKPFKGSQLEDKKRILQTPPPVQTFQPLEEFSTTEQPRQIIRVVNSQQRSRPNHQFQQKEKGIFDSRKLGFQQGQSEGGRIDQQLTSRRQQLRTFPAITETTFKPAKDEAAQIRHRFQVQRQKQIEALAKQSDFENIKPRFQTPTSEEDLQASEEYEDTDRQAQNAKYSFSSSVKDTIHDNQVTREETRDGRKVSGSYSYSDGFVKRTVHYEADEKGYRVVKEETEPIGEGPVEDIDGKVEVTSSVDGNAHGYSITAEDVPELAKLKDEP